MDGVLGDGYDQLGDLGDSFSNSRRSSQLAGAIPIVVGTSCVAILWF
jgi:hypothetical protein